MAIVQTRVCPFIFVFGALEAQSRDLASECFACNGLFPSVKEILANTLIFWQRVSTHIRQGVVRDGNDLSEGEWIVADVSDLNTLVGKVKASKPILVFRVVRL